MSVGSFRTLVADPPWSFGDKLPGGGRGAEKNYKVLSQVDIEQFLDATPLSLDPWSGPGESPVIRDQLAPDCRLFLWRVSSQVEEAYRVCRAWGFAPKTELVWVKLTSSGWVNGGNVDFDFDRVEMEGIVPRLGGGAKVMYGMGRTLRASHESCVVASRGRPGLLSRTGEPAKGAWARSVFAAPFTGHSAKPDEFYELVERTSPGPYLELFGRRRRPGWTVLGDQVGPADCEVDLADEVRLLAEDAG